MKKADNLLFHQDYYNQVIALPANQVMDTSEFHLIHDKLTALNEYTKMYDLYEQWDESSTVFIKNMRINYFLRMRTHQYIQGPIDFTIFIYYNCHVILH